MRQSALDWTKSEVPVVAADDRSVTEGRSEEHPRAHPSPQLRLSLPARRKAVRRSRRAALACADVLPPPLDRGRDGLILVDSRHGAEDVNEPRRLGFLFNAMVRPRLDVAETSSGKSRYELPPKRCSPHRADYLDL